jgi:hypothetical protein
MELWSAFGLVIVVATLTATKNPVEIHSYAGKGLLLEPQGEILLTADRLVITMDEDLTELDTAMGELAESYQRYVYVINSREPAGQKGSKE